MCGLAAPATTFLERDRGYGGAARARGVADLQGKREGKHHDQRKQQGSKTSTLRRSAASIRYLPPSAWEKKSHSGDMSLRRPTQTRLGLSARTPADRGTWGFGEGW